MAAPFTDAERQFVLNAIESGDVFKLITAMEVLQSEGVVNWTAQSFFAPGGTQIEPPLALVLPLRLLQAMSVATGIQDLNQIARSLPLLSLFQSVSIPPIRLQQELLPTEEGGSGATPAELQDRFGAWLFNFESIQNVLNQALQGQGGQLDAIQTFVLQALQRANYSNSDFFAQFQVPGVTLPELPTDPNAAFPGQQPGGGGVTVNIQGPSGDFPGSTTTVIEEFRPPTAQEFMNDFDNALLAFLGTSIEGLSAIQLDSLRDRRNELLADYIVRLSEFAEKGISPFREDTRSGDVVSTSITEPAEEGQPLETTVIREGVSVPADIGIGFATAFVTPTAFLSEMFPTTQSLRAFALAPTGESRLPSSGFTGATAFSRSF